MNWMAITAEKKITQIQFFCTCTTRCCGSNGVSQCWNIFERDRKLIYTNKLMNDENLCTIKRERKKLYLRDSWSHTHTRIPHKLFTDWALSATEEWSDVAATAVLCLWTSLDIDITTTYATYIYTYVFSNEERQKDHLENAHKIS